MICSWFPIETFLPFQDFIYLGQVNMNQDSLPSFLKIAERLKIKGLCESLSPAPMMQRDKMMSPPPNVSHQNFEKMMASPPPNVSHGNFENLLPRSPYVQTEPIVSMPQQVWQRVLLWDIGLGQLTVFQLFIVNRLYGFRLKTLSEEASTSLQTLNSQSFFQK